MTRADVRTLGLSAATGIAVFFTGNRLWPSASLEWFWVAIAAAVVIITVRSDGWRQVAESLAEGLVLWAVLAGLYFLWAMAADWLKS